MVFFISTKYLPQSLTMIGPSWSFNISFHPRFSRFCVACLLLVYNTNVPNLPPSVKSFLLFSLSFCSHLPSCLPQSTFSTSQCFTLTFIFLHLHFHIYSPSLSYFLTFTFIFPHLNFHIFSPSLSYFLKFTFIFPHLHFYISSPSLSHFLTFTFIFPHLHFHIFSFQTSKQSAPGGSPLVLCLLLLRACKPVLR